MPRTRIRSIRYVTAVVCAIVGLSTASPDACTTFCVKSAGRVIFGRNYDFDIGQGLVLLNPRGLRKRGFDPLGPEWVARHGSITFNQFGRDFPMGGMNEAGLVVELMWHERAEYPAADRRAALGVLEWIQYQLDTASTVEDVLRSDGTVRVSGVVPLHYLVSDRAGRVATIEFLRGRLEAHSGESLPVSVLANDTYEDALAFWRGRQGRRAAGSGSDARFARASDAVSRFGDQTADTAVQHAFEILADVVQRSTRWSIVYDQTDRVITYRTDRNVALRVLRFDALDFGCGASARLLDVHAGAAGDVGATMTPYSDARNRELVVSSYSGFSGTRQTPQAEIDRVIAHPSLARCAG